jgi:hypothetical protein
MELKKQMYQLTALFGLLALFILSTGCATQGKSIGLGGVIGAGTGALLGGIVDPGKNGEYRTRNVIIGAAVGGLAGSVTGAAIHENTEREREIAYLKGRESKKTSSKSGAMPSLQNPKVEAQWVENKVVGNRYIEGHFEYIITEPTRWEPAR